MGDAVACDLEPADDRGRNSVDLAHHELGGARDLVGDGDLRRMQLVADPVARAAQVAHHLEAGRTERDVDRPLAPRPPERVRDQHRDGLAGEVAEPFADAGRRCVGIDRQEDEHAGRGSVRRVDTCRGADEPVRRLGDHERRAHAHHARGLAQDHLDPARIVVVAGDLDRLGGRLDGCELDHAPL